MRAGLSRQLPLVILVLASPARAGEAEDLVRRCVAAYGGEAALRGAKAIRQTGVVTAARRGGAEGRLERLFAYPDKLRVEITYPGATELRVLDGAAGWRDGEEVRGPGLGAMVMQATRMAAPLVLLDHLAELKDFGLEERDGQKVRIVAVPLPSGFWLAVHLDPATGWILQTVARGPGGIEFATLYRDHRKVNGLLFAFTERTFALGRYTGETALQRVEVLPAAPKAAFSGPRTTRL